MEEREYRTNLRDLLNGITDINETLLDRVKQLKAYIARAGLEVPSPEAGLMAPIVALDDPEIRRPMKRLRTGEETYSYPNQESIHWSVLEAPREAPNRAGIADQSSHLSVLSEEDEEIEVAHVETVGGAQDSDDEASEEQASQNEEEDIEEDHGLHEQTEKRSLEPVQNSDEYVELSTAEPFHHGSNQLNRHTDTDSLAEEPQFINSRSEDEYEPPTISRIEMDSGPDSYQDGEQPSEQSETSEPVAESVVERKEDTAEERSRVGHIQRAETDIDQQQVELDLQLREEDSMDPHQMEHDLGQQMAGSQLLSESPRQVNNDYGKSVNDTYNKSANVENEEPENNVYDQSVNNDLDQQHSGDDDDEVPVTTDAAQREGSQIDEGEEPRQRPFDETEEKSDDIKPQEDSPESRRSDHGRNALPDLGSSSPVKQFQHLSAIETPRNKTPDVVKSQVVESQAISPQAQKPPVVQPGKTPRRSALRAFQNSSVDGILDIVHKETEEDYRRKEEKQPRTRFSEPAYLRLMDEVPHPGDMQIKRVPLMSSSIDGKNPSRARAQGATSKSQNSPLSGQSWGANKSQSILQEPGSQSVEERQSQDSQKDSPRMSQEEQARRQTDVQIIENDRRIREKLSSSVNQFHGLQPPPALIRSLSRIPGSIAQLRMPKSLSRPGSYSDDSKSGGTSFRAIPDLPLTSSAESVSSSSNRSMGRLRAGQLPSGPASGDVTSSRPSSSTMREFRSSMSFNGREEKTASSGDIGERNLYTVPGPVSDRGDSPNRLGPPLEPNRGGGNNKLTRSTSEAGSVKPQDSALKNVPTATVVNPVRAQYESTPARGRGRPKYRGVSDKSLVSSASTPASQRHSGSFNRHSESDAYVSAASSFSHGVSVNLRATAGGDKSQNSKQSDESSHQVKDLLPSLPPGRSHQRPSDSLSEPKSDRASQNYRNRQSNLLPSSGSRPQVVGNQVHDRGFPANDQQSGDGRNSDKVEAVKPMRKRVKTRPVYEIANMDESLPDMSQLPLQPGDISDIHNPRKSTK